MPGHAVVPGVFSITAAPLQFQDLKTCGQGEDEDEGLLAEKLEMFVEVKDGVVSMFPSLRATESFYCV